MKKFKINTNSEKQKYRECPQIGEEHLHETSNSSYQLNDECLDLHPDFMRREDAEKDKGMF